MDTTTDTHLEALKAKHAALEEAIHQESLRPLPDTTEITRLKREKLQLKQEIEES